MKQDNPMATGRAALRVPAQVAAIIDGVPQWGGEVLPVLDPYTGESIAELHESSAATVAAAVASAERAFRTGPWPQLPVEERQQVLRRVADLIDRDAAALAASQDLVEAGRAELIAADIEGEPWPCPGRQFDAVVVTNYLWRPLWPSLRAALAPGGLLIYETFAAGNESVGKPSRPDFLLLTGELLARCAGLRIVAYEDGFLDNPARFVQRVVAVAPGADTDSPPRHGLQA